MKSNALALLFFLLATLPPHAGQANEVVADLEDHLVAIDTGFSGTNVLLFGATEGTGDVVVVVKGPLKQETVRQKGRVMGVWANIDQVTFDKAPSFYSIAASQPLSKILSEKERKERQIGTEYLQIHRGHNTADISTEKQDSFWQALLQIRKKNGLYTKDPAPIKFLGKRLFRADIVFPSNLPIGTYLVYVYLIQDKNVIHRQITPLRVSKAGAEAKIYDFAQRHGLAYGVLSVLIALFAGWLASIIFRK